MINVTNEEDPSSEAYQFRELMAIMHGDGGQYLARHGAVKAAEDAIAKWYALLRKVEKLEAEILLKRRMVSQLAVEMLK